MEDKRNAPQMLILLFTKDQWETLSTWREQLNNYMEDSYKTNPNSLYKPEALRTCMMGFMNQDWRDIVQDKLKAMKTVAEMDKIKS